MFGTDVLLEPKETSRVSEAEYSQPCCTAIQIALVDLINYYGIKPAAVVGHSSGEIAAVYAAGAISLKQAITTAYYRGKDMLELDPTIGGMAAIGLGAEEIKPLLEPGVVVACENSPQNTTISGDKDVLQRVMKTIKDANPDALVRSLRVDRAYHSRKS